MKPDWMKPKGYLHLTKSLFLHSNWKSLKNKIENPGFVAKYAFYPLIHTVIKERKYKKIDPAKHTGKERGHVHISKNNGKSERTAKLRPLHYATHFDALIYSYYASVLNRKYEELLEQNTELNNAVIAYRKIKVAPDSKQGKSTIHFAKEVFDEIKNRVTPNKGVAVLAFDIKSFFSSLDHTFLKKKWEELVGKNEFDKHHFNVFKACTQFHYVLLDDLRRNDKRNSFDEKKLTGIRRENGHKCFFDSNEDFRNAIKQGKLRIYGNPFYRKSPDGNVNVGIPQGLALSAILANIYLSDFDTIIINTLVKEYGCFYRRYSDDLIVICEIEKIQSIANTVEKLIAEYCLKISTNKTEKFIFSYQPFKGALRLSCSKLLPNNEIGKLNSHMTYLGFEFRGYNTTIKSTNLAKYYRRIISVIKRRAKRAHIHNRKDPTQPIAIYLNQVKKLINKPVKIKDSERTELKKYRRGNYALISQPTGMHRIERKELPANKKTSNYYSYVKRCSEIFDDKIFFRQIKKRRLITYKTIKTHLSKYKKA